ncbi:MAG: alkaline phosphatase D family protein [Bryobacteraceae bacterium]
MTLQPTRRTFLGSALVAGVASAWNQGTVRHILPTANHQRFLVKVSVAEPLARPPVLLAAGNKYTALRTDTEGHYWSFDVGGLKPATSHDLSLSDAHGKRLCDPWPLKTLPHPDERVSRFRLMVYTCAGGNEAQRLDSGQQYWVSVHHRRKLFEAGLALQPDAMVAIGDHVYWDQRFARAGMGASPWFLQYMGGAFQRDIPVLGTPNEQKMKRAVTPQIVDLYGTLFRSTPTHFIQDDHDYFENDEAIASGISFPPDDFMMRLARATQSMYYPEHLPNADRPLGLAGASAGDRGPGLSECYGTLRFGRAAELLLYDCRRFQTLKGPHATLVTEDAEAWLVRRMKDSPCAHVVNMPSMPIAWSAGKWGEWYPDVLGENGMIGTAKPKYFWQEGWKRQHDRLLAASSAMKRVPVFLSGDLHALAHGKIHASRKLDLRRNPVNAVLTGPISTGPRGWPSAARGTPPQVATGIEIDQTLAPLENNGFTIADFFPERIEFQQFRWKIGQPESALDRMTPFHKFTLTPVG